METVTDVVSGSIAQREVSVLISSNGTRAARADSRVRYASDMACFTVHACVAAAFMDAFKVRSATITSVA